jgi:predicted nucleic acid-binding protein
MTDADNSATSPPTLSNRGGFFYQKPITIMSNTFNTDFHFDGHTISFIQDESTSMVNATQLADAIGVRLDNFERSSNYREFVKVLKNSQDFRRKVQRLFLTSEGKNNTDFEKKLNDSIKHVPARETGTFYCEELAIYFCMLNHVKLGLWLTARLQHMIFGKDAAAIKKAVLDLPHAHKMKLQYGRSVKAMKNELADPADLKELNEVTTLKEVKQAEIVRVEHKLYAPELFDDLAELAMMLREKHLELLALDDQISEVTARMEKAFDDPELVQLEANHQKYKDLCKQYNKILRTEH